MLTGLPHNQRWAGAFLGLHVSDSGGSGLQCSSIPPALHTGLWDSPAAVADGFGTAASDPDQAHLHPYESSSGWHPPLLQLRSGQEGHGLPAAGAFTRGNSAHCGELPTSAEGSVNLESDWHRLLFAELQYEPRMYPLDYQCLLGTINNALNHSYSKCTFLPGCNIMQFNSVVEFRHSEEFRVYGTDVQFFKTLQYKYKIKFLIVTFLFWTLEMKWNSLPCFAYVMWCFAHTAEVKSSMFIISPKQEGSYKHFEFEDLGKFNLFWDLL